MEDRRFIIIIPLVILLVLGALAGGGYAYYRAYTNRVLPKASDNLVIPDYVTVEAEKFADKVASRVSEDSFSVCFVSDMHVGGMVLDGIKPVVDDDSVIQAGQALTVYSEITTPDLIVFGGDLVVGDENTGREDSLKLFNNAINYANPAGFTSPLLTLVGNHDDAPYMSTDGRVTSKDLYNTFGKQNAIAGVVTNKEDQGGIYGYLDFPDKKLRVIYLNTDDTQNWESSASTDEDDVAYVNAHNISAGQLNWIASTALDFSGVEDPSQWGIIVVSHVNVIDAKGGKYKDEVSGKTYIFNTYNAAKLFNDYMAGEKRSYSHNGGTVNYDFTNVDKRAAVYCYIHGHDHSFQYDVIGTKKIPSIGVPNADEARVRESDDGVIYAKTKETENFTSFNVITVDRANGMIYADNLGAGYDRKWEYTPDTDLTNLVPDSLDMEAKGPYSDTGYKERCYVVSLKQTIPMDGYVATGLMEWSRRPDNTWGSVYVKGAELDTNDPYVRGLFVKVEDGVLMPTVYISGGTEDTASQNWEDHFIVEKLGEQYYKLTPTGDIYSIGYATQYIQLSLKGTGENLIVTVDEPIE